MNNTKIKSQIQHLVKNIKGEFGIPMHKKEIKEWEIKLGVTLPSEYKDFLQSFGYLFASGIEILGGQVLFFL